MTAQGTNDVNGDRIDGPTAGNFTADEAHYLRELRDFSSTGKHPTVVVPSRLFLKLLLLFDSVPKKGSPGAQRIAKERARQLSDEGYDADHDDEHDGGELALAAALYATPELLYIARQFAGGIAYQDAWPWPGYDGRWNPNGANYPHPNADAPIDERIRMLEKSGALCAAEIDRLLRLKEKPPCPECELVLAATPLGTACSCAACGAEYDEDHARAG